MDAADFRVAEVLRNGLAVTIRAIRPGDKLGVADAFSNLEAESVQTRFFGPKASLSEQELKAATEVDFEDVVALVVAIETDGGETIIGGGRYLAFDAPGGRSAEIAFLVEEDFAGLGIAGRLLKHLTAIARAKGVARFVAEVLRQNASMLRVFDRSGLPMTLTREDDTIHVTLSLTGPAAALR